MFKTQAMKCPKCGSNDYYFDGLCFVCTECGYYTK